jgi:hypothetical protein
MPIIITKAPFEIVELVAKVKEENHHPRLEQASVAACLADSKPFRQNNFNWGTVCKFSDFNKIWQKEKYDFCIKLCVDVWYQILSEEQREALVDLHLTCCDVEYEPETTDVNGKKQIIKDEWGRIQYSDTIKTDDAGQPKWRIKPLGLTVFAANVRRYNLWMKDVIDGLDGLTVIENE